MQEEACLITTARASPETRKIEKLLAFFGLTGRSVAADAFWKEGRSHGPDVKRARLFCSAAGLLDLLVAVERPSGEARRWPEHVHSVFVHADGEIESMLRLLGLLTNEATAPLKENAPAAARWTISGKMEGFGGVMAGLEVHPSERAHNKFHVVDLEQTEGIPLISSADGDAVFFALSWKGVPIYICLVGTLVDLDDELRTPNFDVRDHFFSAVPIVLYLRWAFPDSAWQAPAAGACLIIDDPLLKPRYGFVRFRSLFALMEEHDFSTNVAFIPWNWRRSDPDVVRLFRENPNRFSLSVHGCDHTAEEFGTDEISKVRPMIEHAAARMSAHETRTGLPHDRIMVFPQGVFSATAMRELKQTGFTAAVNTEVACSGRNDGRIRIRDVWDVAVRNYADFPLYTRRYPRQGIENFAFDVLLGKPCLVVIHHDFCRNKCRDLIEFIQRLNALRLPPTWRSLKEVVRRSYRFRELSPALQEIEMYGTEILIENPSQNTKLFRIKRRETEPDSVSEIRAGSDSLPWEVAGEYLQFEISLPPGEDTLIRVCRVQQKQSARNGQDHPGFKVRLRRYLSEFRDNYVVPARSRLAALTGSS